MDCQDNVIDLASYRLWGLRRRFNSALLTHDTEAMWKIREDLATFRAGRDPMDGATREASALIDQARDFLRDGPETKIS